MNTELIATQIDVLMECYADHYRGTEWVATSVEQTRVLPIVNPDTNRTARVYSHVGKTDLIVTGYGKTMLMDHKSTSDSIEDPDAPYWRILNIDGQISKYTLQEWQAGTKVDGFIYDVIKKPTIRPKQIPKNVRKQIIEFGEYFHQQVSKETLHEIVVDGLDRENMELYAMRLRDEIKGNLTKYFQRRTIYRNDHEVIEYAEELWQIQQEIREAANNDRWFRNPDSCMNYNRPCEFLGVCSGHDTLDSDRWKRVDCVHEELDGIDGDGRELLTNSSIKCFQSCRRKYKFRYVDGVRRNTEEEEALYFGRELHERLEQYWLETMEKEHGNSDTKPVSGVGSGASQSEGFSWSD